MDMVILTGATLIDGTGAPPAAGRVVVVEDGRIAAVVPEAQAPAGAARRLRLVLARGRVVVDRVDAGRRA